jgi:DNA-binding GntR family transcriptional regulator
MKELVLAPKLVERVHDAILAEIAEGRLAAGDRIIQEQVAHTLGVSRQPVQQAMLLLRKQGVLREAPGRGLSVAPLDLDFVRSMYEVRSVLEGLAARLAAERSAGRAREEGPALIRAGRKAVRSGSVVAMIEADRRVHDFISELSGNPMIAPALQAQWTGTTRVTAEVLLRDDWPCDVWDQHAAMLDAIGAGRAATAEKLARQHVMGAANFMITRLHGDAKPPAGRPRPGGRQKRPVGTAGRRPPKT